MKRGSKIPLSTAGLPLAALAALWIAGCGETVITGKIKDNIPPAIELTDGPVEGDSVEYRVQFFWSGEDPDGSIDHYDIILVEGDPIGFNPIDTIGSHKWTRTISTDTLIIARADEYSSNVSINQSLYSIFQKTHTFFARAVDDRGAVSQTAYCSFTAWTLAPHVIITNPTFSGNAIVSLSPVTTFEWYGKDPITAPYDYQEVDSTRWLVIPYVENIVTDLNMHPANYEDLWSPWRHYKAEGDSGISTVIGDDELIIANSTYLFAVQAKDEAGAVSAIFDQRSNACAYYVRIPTGPILDVMEAYLGKFTYMGVDMLAKQIQIPPGFEVNFYWTANASHYGGYVSTYRYGWDIGDLNDPAAWATLPKPNVVEAVPRTFYSGVHTLYVETIDNMGIKTLGILEMDVIPVVMQRDLLWVDDFPSNDFAQTNYAWATESEHDEFWMDICMRVPEFNPVRDVFDVSQNNFLPPPMAHLYRYRNIIWSYSSAIGSDGGSVWTRMILFKPAELFGLEANLNVLPFYLAYGGHVWSEGPSQRMGGLGALLPIGTRLYPNYLVYEAVNPGTPPPYDTLGVRCMAYRDYCVSVLDKVDANIKIYTPFERSMKLDAFRYGFRDNSDEVTLAHPGMPARLDLWEIITAPGMFFEPAVRGFHYIEIYDPAYWMEFNELESQDCFHPIYRYRAMTTKSVLDKQTVAFWTTKYADVVAPSDGTIAAPSVQFGLPLWFFNREQVDSIADVIFETWQIK